MKLIFFSKFYIQRQRRLFWSIIGSWSWSSKAESHPKVTTHLKLRLVKSIMLKWFQWYWFMRFCWFKWFRFSWFRWLPLLALFTAYTYFGSLPSLLVCTGIISRQTSHFVTLKNENQSICFKNDFPCDFSF